MRLSHIIWAIAVCVVVYFIATTYGQGFLVQQQTAWALAEAARLNAKANLITAETLRAVMTHNNLFQWVQLTLSIVMVVLFASQRVVYIPSDKGRGSGK